MTMTKDVSTESIAERTLGILAAIAETHEVYQDRDLRLYESGVLESLTTVDLMVALSKEFHVEISPAEFGREQWMTPNRIVADMQQKVAAEAARPSVSSDGPA
jgi:D-alanine--poly(phosphoribitol) ligase subunit 2